MYLCCKKQISVC